MAGKKFDQGKPKLSLISKAALWGMGQALTYGMHKYGQWNYKNGLAYSRLLDAALRHLTQFNDGEDIDSESGNHHLFHAMASIAMLIDTIELHPEMDDRYHKPKQKRVKRGKAKKN